MSHKPVLYSIWSSSCTARVRIALNLKKVDYEYKAVDADHGRSDPEFIKINPARKVPVLVIDGQPLTESLAIIEYIEEMYPSIPLLPRDPIKKAQARAIALQITAGIQPLQNTRVRTYAKTNGIEENEADWAVHWITDGLRDLEKMLEKTAGKYAVGDEVSVADLSIPSIIFNAEKKFNMELSEFRILQRVNKNLSELEAFKAAAPENQPDAKEHL